MAKKKSNKDDMELINRVNSHIRDLQRNIKVNIDQLNQLTFDVKLFKDGIISDKQFQDFKKRITEIKQAVSDINSSVSGAERVYNSKVERYTKVDQQYREQTKNLSGKNKVPESYTKLSDERDKLTQELKDLRLAIEQLKSNNNGYSEYVNSNTQKAENDVNSMHKDRPVLKQAVNTGMRMLTNEFTVNNPSELIRYMKSGSYSIRNSEEQAYKVGQKIGYGEYDNDRALFKESRNVGLENQYNSYETLSTQRQLIQGGYQQNNTQALLQDTRSTQEMTRAYSISDSTVVGKYNELKKMGALTDGEMNKFSTMIAGAIDKTKMRGREEELVRSVSSLVTKVGDNQATVSSNSVYETTGIQTLLGESVSSLNGDRGSNLLSSMDSAIKGSSNTMDILLGKGSQYVGIQGMYDLEKQKEKGLTVDNLKSTLEQSRRIYGGDNSASRLALKSAFQGSLSISQIEELSDSGFFDKILNSDSSAFTQESINQLNDLGLSDLASQLESYGNSETRDTYNNSAVSSETQQKTSNLYERATKGISNTISGLPSWMRVGGTIASGLGVGKLLTNKIGGSGGISKKIYQTLNKTIFPNVGGTGGLGGKVSSAYSKVNSTLSNITGVDGLLPSSSNKPIQFLSKYGDDLVEYGAKSTGVLSKISTAGGKGLTSASKVLGKVGKATPIISGIIDYGLDRLENPETNKGRSASKAVGSTVGSIAGTALAAIAMGALGIATGGIAPLAIGAVSAIGGGIIGSKVGDSAYTAIKGDSDKQKASGTTSIASSTTTTSTTGTNTSSTSGSETVESMKVSSLYINDRTLAQNNFISKNSDMNSKYEVYSNQKSGVSTYNPTNTEGGSSSQTVNIKISGSIDGMSKSNENEIKNSLTSFFNSYTPSAKRLERSLLYESR